MFDDLVQRCRELAQLFRADELRQRLLEQLVWAEAEQLGHRVISLQNLALEVRHENRIGGIRDDDLGVERAAGLALVTIVTRFCGRPERAGHRCHPPGCVMGPCRGCGHAKPVGNPMRTCTWRTNGPARATRSPVDASTCASSKGWPMMSPNAVQSPVLGHAALLTPSTSTHGRTCCARLAGESGVLPYAIEKKCVRTAHEFPKVPIQAACREVKDIQTALAM